MMSPMKDYGEKSLPQISDFSKHLMLLIIAVFAMLTPLLFNSNDFNVRILLYLTVLLVFVGLYFGHQVLTIIIELYLNPDSEKIDFHTVKPVINVLRRQFLFSILSVLFLVITYGYHVVKAPNLENEKFKSLSQKIQLLENKTTVKMAVEEKLNQLKKQVSENKKETRELILKISNIESELHTLKLEQNKIIAKQELILQNNKQHNK